MMAAAFVNAQRLAQQTADQAKQRATTTACGRRRGALRSRSRAAFTMWRAQRRRRRKERAAAAPRRWVRVVEVVVLSRLNSKPISRSMKLRRALQVSDRARFRSFFGML